MFSITPFFRSSHSCNIYSFVSTQVQWHNKMITFSKHDFLMCFGRPYTIVYCFLYLTAYKIVIYGSVFNSDTPISCVYLCLSVTHRCTCWSTSLWSVTVPHDFSHKTSNCQCISQHQQIERRLQVSDIDNIARVSESRIIQLWHHFKFIKTPFLYMHKNSSLDYMK